MRSLLWKEWHEQSWKLAFSCILLGAMAAIGLHARIIADSGVIILVCLFGMALPISYSSGVLPAERNDGYFESLIALPIAPWKILFAKTCLGIALCIIPLFMAMLISLLGFGGREMADGMILGLYLRSIFAAVLLFMWMLALTSQLPSETRAGLLGVGIFICWALLTAGLSETKYYLAIALTPIGFALDLHDLSTSRPPHWFIVLAYIAAIVIQLGVATVLWIWTSRRFAASLEGRP